MLRKRQVVNYPAEAGVPANSLLQMVRMFDIGAPPSLPAIADEVIV